MKILFLGDIVGQPGRESVRGLLPDLVRSESISYVVANGENAAAGSGITPSIAKDLYSYGVDAITMGDHLWRQKDVSQLLQNDNRFFRPLNYPSGTIGRGSGVIEKEGMPSVGVLNIQGRTFMQPLENPFNLILPAIEQIRKITPIVLVDFHAEATSEKIAMGWYVDGKVSLLVGTHTHVQTADDQILPKGTGYLTDAGFCGGHLGVIGREIDPVIKGFQTMCPQRFPVANGNPKLNGVMVEVDPSSGQCTQITRISRSLPGDGGQDQIERQSL